MIVNVKVVWGTEEQAIANAASFTKYRVKAASGVVILPISEREFTFSELDLEAGTHPASVELVTEDEQTVGGMISGNFEVVAVATAPVPMTITVSLV